MRRNVYVIGDNQFGIDTAITLCTKPTNAVTLVNEGAFWGNDRVSELKAEESAGRLFMMNFHKLRYTRPYAVVVCDRDWLDTAWAALVLQRPLPCYFIAFETRDLLQLALRGASTPLITAVYRNGVLLCPDDSEVPIRELMEGVR